MIQVIYNQHTAPVHPFGGFNQQKMERQEIINKIEKKIARYNESKERLDEMREAWDKYEDPASDPGWQFSMEVEVERKFTEILMFVKAIDPITLEIGNL